MASRFRNNDFQKITKQIQTIGKANKITIRFPLSFLFKQCVENGFQNKTFCHYVVECDGQVTLAKLLDKFQEVEMVSIQLMCILRQCLVSLSDTIVNVKIAETGIAKTLFNIVEKGQYEEQREIAFDIINKISYETMNHEKLLKDGILDFEQKQFTKIQQMDIQKLKQTDIPLIARTFDILRSMGSNEENVDSILQKKLIEKVVEIYNQNHEVDFIRELLVTTLIPICDHERGREIIKKSNLNEQKLANDFVQDSQMQSIEILQDLIHNLIVEEDVEKLKKQLESGNFQNNQLVLLSLISSNKEFSDILCCEGVINQLLDLLINTKDSQWEKMYIMKSLEKLLREDTKLIKIIEDRKAFDVILNSIKNSSDENFLLLDSCIQFLVVLLQIKGKSFSDQICQIGIDHSLMKKYCSLNKMFNSFKVKALTNEKAQDSLEWHKSLASRVLLKTKKVIDEKKLVSQQLAFNYICCEKLCLSLLQFFGVLRQSNADIKIDYNSEFFETTMSLMKVFKTSRKIHEKIFHSLSFEEFTQEQGLSLIQSNYMVYLCNVIWANPTWNLLGYHLINFIEKLIKNKSIREQLKQGAAAIKLVASIKNFLDEDEYKDFYTKKRVASELTYTQEDEINKKSSIIIDKLLNSSILETFKQNISKTIKSFKPKPETITILRSEYAVLTVANGLNTFGTEGLKQNLQEWLVENINDIEKAVKRKDFRDKDQLLGDCIKCLTHYAKITWNEKSRNLYQKRGVSEKIFNLFDTYLTESKSPLRSFVMLRVFREWLVERIKIIENASNLERTKIYDSKNFMMVDKKIQNELITKVMDSLYVTHQKYGSNEKVAKINMEVIILLGYIYPDWKWKTGKNFIPQILDIIDNNDFHIDTHIKALNALNTMTGCDKQSEAKNDDILDFTLEKGAIDKVAGCVSIHNFNEQIEKPAKNFFKNFVNSDENLKESYNRIDDLLNHIKNYNQQSKKDDIDDLKEIDEAVNELNALCLVEPLKVYAYSKQHPEIINNTWGSINDMNKGQNKPELKSVLKRLENGCAVAIKSHVKDIKIPHQKNQLLNDIVTAGSDTQNLMFNCLNSLIHHEKYSPLVKINCQIINSFFPSENQDSIKNLSKKLKIQKNLDKLLKTYEKQKENDVGKEVTQTYLNLSTQLNDQMIGKAIKKQVNQLKNSLNQDDIKNCILSVKQMIPFTKSEIYHSSFEELGILDYILRMLKLLHKNFKQKTGQNCEESLVDSLGNSSTPNLGLEKSKKLGEEIGLSNHLVDLILSLPENLKEKVRKHPKIVELSNILGILSEDSKSVEVFKDFLKNSQNKEIMKSNFTFEVLVFQTVKNNNDFQSYNAKKDGANMTMTNLSLLQRSLVKGAESSSISMKQSILKQAVEDQKILINFGEISEKLMDQENYEDLLKKYIKANKNYLPDNPVCFANLMSTSRQIAAILQSDDTQLPLKKYAKKLKEAFQVFLEKQSKEKNPNKKLMKYFQDNFNHIGNLFRNTPHSFQSAKMWNKMIKRYYLQSPNLLDQNTDIILENIEIVRPDRPKLKVRKFFKEKAMEIVFEEKENQGIMDKDNAVNAPQIAQIFFERKHQDKKRPVQRARILRDLIERPEFCLEIVDKGYLDQFLGDVVSYLEGDDSELFELQSECLQKLIDQSKKLPEKKQKKIKKKLANLITPLTRSLEENKEDFQEPIMKILQKLAGYIPNQQRKAWHKMPKILKNLEQTNWNNNNQFILMLQNLSKDQKIQEILMDEEMVLDVMKDLKEDIYGSNPQLVNKKSFKFFKDETDLDENPQKQLAELKIEYLGRLSENKKLARKIAEEKDHPYQVFKLYDEFERMGNYPVVAANTVRIIKNAVKQMTIEEMEAFQPEIEKLIQKLPKAIQKYKSHQSTKKYLEEILDMLKRFDQKRAPKTIIESLKRALGNNKKIDSLLQDNDDLAKTYEELNKILESQPLDEQENEILKLLNDKTKALLNRPNSDVGEALCVKNVPKHMFGICQSPFSSPGQKSETLKNLNKIFQNPQQTLEFSIQEKFPLQTGNNINRILKGEKEVGGGDLELEGWLDLGKNLTDVPEGAENMLSGDKDKLMINLSDVITSADQNQKIKSNACQLLNNLIKYSQDLSGLESLQQQMPTLLNKNQQNQELFSDLVDLAKEMGKINKDGSPLNDELIQELDEGLDFHKDQIKPQKEIAGLIETLADKNPDFAKKIMEKGIAPKLAKPFKNLKNGKELHKNIAKMIMKLGYGSPERKNQLVNQGYVKGLVELLNHYSSDQNYDQEMIENVLKCMANFTLVPSGSQELLNDGVIPAFKKFFKKYKNQLPEECQLMLQVLTNLTFEPNPSFTKKIIKDKGLELILEAMDHYHNNGNLENTEKAIDALTHMCKSPESLKYLEETKNKAPDILVDIVRQKQGSDLIYKTLRCLSELANSEKLQDQILKKNGQAAVAALYEEFQDDLKIVFQATKFLQQMVKKNPDKINEFVFSGIPDKIIDNYRSKWPKEIHKEIIELFTEMAPNEEVKDICGEKFLNQLIPIMDKYIGYKNIIKNGSKLLSLCSDNITSAESAKELKGNKLGDEVLRNYLTSEEILQNNLEFMENMIRMNKESKQEYLDMKTDDEIENLIDTLSPEVQKDLYDQAKTVLDLLRDQQPKRREVKGDVPGDSEEDSPDQEMQITEDIFEEVVPPNIRKFLIQGKILRVYGEDSVARSMHVYLSKDLQFLNCKHPKENFVKQKWIISMHHIKDIKMGYQDGSPIANSGSFFTRAPQKNHCFTVYGPIVYEGHKNFYLKCANRFDAQKWVDYLGQVFEAYKKEKARRLKQDTEIA